MTTDDLKDLIEAGMDIESFMDFLNIEFREVIDCFDDTIEDNRERLRKELG